MLKIFLVEDELIVREGIKRKINWQKEGFEFVGEASDGELAFPMIQTLQPDIVITDIKMPFVDGLELSKMVREEFPEIKILILSGYGEFSYAKEAIKIGVTEYLLKPISSEKLLDAVKGVAKSINNEKEQKRLWEQFQIERQESKIVDKQKFFCDLVGKELSMTEIMSRAKKLDMDLIACAYNIVLYKLSIPSDGVNSYSERLIEVAEEIQDYIRQFSQVELFHRDTEGEAILFKVDSQKEFDELSKQMMDGMIDILSKNSDIVYFFAIGKLVQRLRELPESFHEASRTFSYRYLGKNNQVVSYNKVGEIQLLLDENIDLSQVDHGKVDRIILDNFLRSGSIQEVEQFIHDYFHGIGILNMKSFLFRQYIVMDIYFAIVNFLETLEQDTSLIEEQFHGINEMGAMLSDLNTTMKCVEQILKTVMQIRDKASLKKYSELLQNATKFIRENFDKEEISLHTVAASVNVSPSHFSSIFSKEMGETFIEFLTEVRMERAKELLMCTSKKTSDIGYEVGYKDSHYFSYLFRKTQDCSPKEFRMRRTERD